MLIISRLIFFIFLFSICLNNSYADQNDCNFFKKKKENFNLSLIDIKIDDYKKWQVNNLRINSLTQFIFVFASQ